MDEFAQQAAREIANIELRRRTPYTASKIRCSVFNNPLDPSEFECRIVDLTPEIRREADRIRDMKKKMFETMTDDEIIDTIAQAGNGYLIAIPQPGGVKILRGGKMGNGDNLVGVARQQLSQPEFLQNKYFDKNSTSGPMIDMLIALQWRHGAVYGVVLDEKGHQKEWAYNIDSMLEQLCNLIESIT